MKKTSGAHWLHCQKMHTKGELAVLAKLQAYARRLLKLRSVRKCKQLRAQKHQPMAVSSADQVE